MMEFLKFGDIIDNGYASETNPFKYGIVIYSRGTKQGGIRLTNGRGEFWTVDPHDRITKVGSVWKEAIEALRAVAADQEGEAHHGNG
jgi:hypothetical protein